MNFKAVFLCKFGDQSCVNTFKGTTIRKRMEFWGGIHGSNSEYPVFDGREFVHWCTVVRHVSRHTPFNIRFISSPTTSEREHYRGSYRGHGWNFPILTFGE